MRTFNISIILFFVNFLWMNGSDRMAEAKTTIVFYDEIKPCDDFCSGDECFDFFDISSLKMILDEDDYTKAYLNGTFKINVSVKSPFPSAAWTEKRYGTAWATEAFYRRYDDICTGFKNPLDPVYDFYKNQKSCPYEKGQEITWIMKKIQLPLMVPPQFLGEWRLNFATEMEYEGKLRKQCNYARGDVLDG